MGNRSDKARLLDVNKDFTVCLDKHQLLDVGARYVWGGEGIVA